EGGSCTFSAHLTPLPNPPPQGGREQAEFAAPTDSTSPGHVLTVTGEEETQPFRYPLLRRRASRRFCALSAAFCGSHFSSTTSITMSRRMPEPSTSRSEDFAVMSDQSTISVGLP